MRNFLNFSKIVKFGSVYESFIMKLSSVVDLNLGHSVLFTVSKNLKLFFENFFWFNNFENFVEPC